MTVIHHLNCGTLRPFGFVLSDTATLFSKAYLVVHCLLIESSDGLILVDSGYGIKDRTNPNLPMRAFMAISGSAHDLREAAANQVLALGYQIEDVRHIIQTHLHLDHAGGLPDFPHAKVHVHALEFQAAQNAKTFLEHYLLREHWVHQPDWELYDSTAEEWFGFDAIRLLKNVAPEIWLIPLPGHTRGHCGVAIKTDETWLLHCGDAYLSRSDIAPEESTRSRPNWIQPFAERLFPHVPRLRALHKKHGDEIEIFCSHDPFELARFQSD